MCGEFGEVSGIIDLVINFLAAGTLFLNSYDTLSYVLDAVKDPKISNHHLVSMLDGLKEEGGNSYNLLYFYYKSH